MRLYLASFTARARFRKEVKPMLPHHQGFINGMLTCTRHSDSRISSTIIFVASHSVQGMFIDSEGNKIGLHHL